MPAFDEHTNVQSPKIVRKHTLAKILEVSPRTINNWIASGVIPVIKIKRVVLFDVDAVVVALQKFERRAVT